MSVEQLESAVSQLSAPDLARFAHWFEEFKADEWDRTIAAEAAAGRFDEAGRRAEADFDAGRCTPL